MKTNEKPSDAQQYRAGYLASVNAYVERLKKTAEAERERFATPEKMRENQEEFRRAYYSMLGRPLTELDEYRKKPVLLLEQTEIDKDDRYTLYRMRLGTEGTADGFAMYGVLFLPHCVTADTPFFISQHGGLGTPELCSGLYGSSSNYNRQTERLLERGAVVFAPQLLLWGKDYGDEYNRQETDSRLKQCGSSIQALEVFGIMRCLDYFETMPYWNADHVGMIGLSYGGLYTLMTAAADTRLRANYASCSYNERFVHGGSDWRWQNSGATFFDAEIAALVAPRAICFDEGDSDPLFRAEGTRREFGRLRPFYEAWGAGDKCALFLFSGGHELMPDNAGVEFLFRNI